MQEQLPRGVAVVAAFYKTLPVLCPSGQLKYSCSILLPAKLVWVHFWAVAKEPVNIILAPAVRIPQCLTKKPPVNIAKTTPGPPYFR